MFVIDKEKQRDMYPVCGVAQMPIPLRLLVGEMLSLSTSTRGDVGREIEEGEYGSIGRGGGEKGRG